MLDRSREVGLKFYLGVFFSHRLRTHVQHNLRLETEVSLFRGLNFSPTSLLLSSTVLNFDQLLLCKERAISEMPPLTENGVLCVLGTVNYQDKFIHSP